MQRLPLFVAGNGFVTQNSKDRIIFNIVEPFFNVVPPNITVTGNDLPNHGFLKTYMLRARGRIVSHVRATINRLPQLEIHPDCDDRIAKITTLNARSVSHSSALLMGNLTKGKNVDAWFAYGRRSSNAICDGSKRDGKGKYTATRRVSARVSGLRANTVYYYRACAKGTKGGANSGDLRQFITKRTPAPPPPPPPEPAKIRLLDIVEVGSPSNFRHPSLQVRITQGINVDAWGYIYDASIRLPSCSRDAGKYDGKGKYSENEDTGFGVDGIYRIKLPGNLPINRIYVAKVCAKSTVGKVYNSGVLYFSTDPYGQNARCRPAARTCK